MGIYVEPVRPDFWQLAKDASGALIDRWGSLDCGTHSAARAAMRALEGIKSSRVIGAWPPDGEFIRSVTRNSDGSLDRSGGVNPAQMDAVLNRYYGVDLDVRYALRFADLVDMVEATRGAWVAVRYDPIRVSNFRGSFTFRENHALFLSGVDRARGVFTDVVDPLADGRLTGSGRVFKGPADYPFELVKRALGALDVRPVGSSTYRALGYGLCYAALTPPTGDAPQPPSWTINLAANATIRIYSIGAGGCLSFWVDRKWGTRPSSAPCGAPHPRKTCDGRSSATVVLVQRGAFAGKVVRSYSGGVSVTVR